MSRDQWLPGPADEPLPRRAVTALHSQLDRRVREARGVRQRVVAELRGGSLGYPLHPVLVDLAGAYWTASITLDVLAIGAGRFRPAADAMLVAGVAASVPTMASGLLEWLALRPSLRVRGLCHGSLGVTTSVLYAVSLLLRVAGRRKTAVLVSALASGTAIAAAHLGGQLVFNHGAGQRESGADENLEGARSS